MILNQWYAILPSKVVKSNQSGIKKQIREFILSLGADVCGVANIDRFSKAPVGFYPKDIFLDCKSVIAFAFCFNSK